MQDVPIADTGHITNEFGELSIEERLCRMRAEGLADLALELVCMRHEIL